MLTIISLCVLMGRRIYELNSQPIVDASIGQSENGGRRKAKA
jgi:hypothetical protein